MNSGHMEQEQHRRDAEDPDVRQFIADMLKELAAMAGAIGDADLQARLMAIRQRRDYQA